MGEDLNLQQERPPDGTAARRRRHRRVGKASVALAAWLGCAPPVVVAGESDAPRTGPRVRITLASSGKRFVGRLVEQNEEILLLEKGRRKEPELVRIPRYDVARFERRVRRSRKGRGVGVGFLVGAAVAVGVGYAGGNDCIEDAVGFDNLSNILCSRTDKTLALGLLTVPLGVLLGAAITPGEQWRSESPPRVAVGAGPAPGGGVFARVAVRF